MGNKQSKNNPSKQGQVMEATLDNSLEFKRIFKNISAKLILDD